MKKFGVLGVEGHVWYDFIDRTLYCVGAIGTDGEVEPFADDYIAELAEMNIEDYIVAMDNVTEKRLSYTYVSDNTMLRETDTYFFNKEDAQKVADYLNGK